MKIFLKSSYWVVQNGLWKGDLLEESKPMGIPLPLTHVCPLPPLGIQRGKGTSKWRGTSTTGSALPVPTPFPKRGRRSKI